MIEQYEVTPLILRRRVLGLSPTAAAVKAGLHPDTVFRIEEGKNCHPASVKTYADSLGVKMEEIAVEPEK